MFAVVAVILSNLKVKNGINVGIKRVSACLIACVVLINTSFCIFEEVIDCHGDGCLTECPHPRKVIHYTHKHAHTQALASLICPAD